MRRSRGRSNRTRSRCSGRSRSRRSAIGTGSPSPKARALRAPHVRVRSSGSISTSGADSVRRPIGRSKRRRRLRRVRRGTPRPPRSRRSSSQVNAEPIAAPSSSASTSVGIMPVSPIPTQPSGATVPARVRTTSAVARSQSAGSCSARPGAFLRVSYSARAFARIPPASDTTTPLRLEVPRSRPTKTSSVKAHPSLARRLAASGRRPRGCGRTRRTGSRRVPDGRARRDPSSPATTG